MKVQMREVFYAGFMCSDSERIPMNESVPSGCFAHRVVEREELISESGEVLKGVWIQVGKEVVYGKILTLNDVAVDTILHCNMVSNGWDKVVRTDRGTTILYSEDMEVISR